MSAISMLLPDLSNLPKIVSKYEQLIEEAEINLSLKEKSLFQCNVEQPTWYSYYNQLYQDLKTIETVVENKMLHTKGTLWRNYKENHSISLSSTDITHYIEGTPEYAKFHTYLLVIRELVGNMYALVKAFEQRGYALKNLTLIRVHEIQQIT